MEFVVPQAFCVHRKPRKGRRDACGTQEPVRVIAQRSIPVGIGREIPVGDQARFWRLHASKRSPEVRPPAQIYTRKGAVPWRAPHLLLRSRMSFRAAA